MVAFSLNVFFIALWKVKKMDKMKSNIKNYYRNCF